MSPKLAHKNREDKLKTNREGKIKACNTSLQSRSEKMPKANNNMSVHIRAHHGTTKSERYQKYHSHITNKKHTTGHIRPALTAPRSLCSNHC